MRGAMVAVTAALAAGGTILGVGRFAAQMASIGDQADKTARAVGITTRELFQWRAVVGNAGGQAEQFEAGIKNLAKQYRDALKGGEDQIKLFRQLGVSLRDSAGRTRSLGDVVEDSVLGLRNFENTAQRAAVADDLFAEAGQTLIRVSLDGADALREQRAAFDRLNQGGRFDHFVEVSKENAAAFDGWRNASEALKRNLATALIPAITALVKGATAVVEWFQRTSRGSRILEVAVGALSFALAVLAGAFVVAFAYPLAILALVVAGVAAVLLVVDDLIALFSGGKSVIGAAIDALFGVGSAQAVVKALTRAFDQLVDGVAWLMEVVVDAGRVVARVLGRVFGWVSERVQALMEDARSLAAILGPEIQAVWEAVATVIEAVVARVSAIVDDVVAKVTGAIGYVTDLAGRAADLLGLGDDERPAPLQVPVLPARAAARGAVVDRRGAPAPAEVRVEQPVSITVNGAGDPQGVALRVREAVGEAMRGELELARELLLGPAR